MRFLRIALSVALFGVVAAHAQALPPIVADLFAKANVPLDNVAVIVKEVGAKDALVSINAAKSMNPASVIKLVTTYAGLELLGPAYTWKTEVFTAGEMRGGTLQGDLVLKGSGDPKLTVERFAWVVKQLRDHGLDQIQGDLILDRTAFENVVHDEQGHMVNPQLRNCRIPTYADTPHTDIFFANTVDTIGPLGAKSQGECGINPVAPAVSNALANATGVRYAHLPFRPDRLFDKLPARS